jgi:hypothetical protein
MIESECPVLECSVSFKRGRQGRKRLMAAARTNASSGRVPRVSRLVALALKLDSQIRAGELEDWAAVARLGHMTRARASQISALTLLAPDIIEAVLHLPIVVRGRDPITERDLRPVTAVPSWRKQRLMWKELFQQRIS